MKTEADSAHKLQPPENGLHFLTESASGIRITDIQDDYKDVFDFL